MMRVCALLLGLGVAAGAQLGGGSPAAAQSDQRLSMNARRATAGLHHPNRRAPTQEEDGHGESLNAAPAESKEDSKEVEHGQAPALSPSNHLEHGLASAPLPSSLSSASSPEFRQHLSALYSHLSRGLDPLVRDSVSELVERVAEGLCADADQKDVQTLAQETAAYQASMHPDFARLAARLAVARLHEHTSPSLIESLRALRSHVGPEGRAAPLVTAEILQLAEEMAEPLEAALVHERDYELDYFGLRTLQRSYLLGSTAAGTSVERPQHLLMRVALAVHGRDLSAVLTSYDLMSRGFFTHATPTLFNAGCIRGQLCSCFLLTAIEDSVEGIFDTLRQCALISRSAGGIGLSVSHIRSAGAYIRSTGGQVNRKTREGV